MTVPPIGLTALTTRIFDIVAASSTTSAIGFPSGYRKARGDRAALAATVDAPLV